MRPGDLARVEQMWIAAFSAAIAGYQPDPAIDELDGDEREQEYLNEVVNYAENVAENSVRIFKEKFLAVKRRGRARDDDEEGDDDD